MVWILNELGLKFYKIDIKVEVNLDKYFIYDLEIKQPLEKIIEQTLYTARGQLAVCHVIFIIFLSL